MDMKPQDMAYLCKADKMAFAAALSKVKKYKTTSEAPYPASGYAHRG